MSQDIFADLIIGYPIDLEQFRVVIPEESHMEERFSETTCEKLKDPVKVVDKEEEWIYRYEDVEHEFSDEFAEKLGEKLGVCVSGHEEWVDLDWYISVPMDSSSVKGLQKAIDGVKEFKKLVKRLGFKVGKFEVDIKIGVVG